MMLPIGYDSFGLIDQSLLLSAIGQELKSHTNQILVDIVANLWAVENEFVVKTTL
mgnify:CR=1 FL=1